MQIVGICVFGFTLLSDGRPFTWDDFIFQNILLPLSFFNCLVVHYSMMKAQNRCEQIYRT